MSEQQLNLFGEEVIETAVKRIGRNERFEDYEAFIDKHEIKKTTDDCYTPPEVYKVIRDYVGELTDLSDRAVVRPFFPGGDYQRFGYPEDCIVIDNPPFSIITKIVRWYDQAGTEDDNENGGDAGDDNTNGGNQGGNNNNPPSGELEG